MKHIVFTFAEPIVAIQRVRNEVFPSDNSITVYHKEIGGRLFNMLKNFGVECRYVGHNITIRGDYHIYINPDCMDEFYIVKGEDNIEALDSVDYMLRELKEEK